MLQSSVYAFLKAHKSVFKTRFKRGLVLLSDNYKNAIACSDVAKFLGFETFILPDFRAIFGDDLRSYQEELRAIFTTLKSFYASEGNKIVCAPVSTLLHSMPNAQSLQEKLLRVGDSIEFKNFKEDLLHFGYEFVDLVELSGEVSIRGDIIDIFTSPI